MIRRDLTQPDGQRFWLLIPQISHAKLAADLSSGWTSPPLLESPASHELLLAILHHDDGWASWDAEPGVDPDTGTPANFNEMLLGESLAIWRHSISACKQYGPLASYAVAGHFSALLRRFDSWKQSLTKRQLAEKFLTYYDRQMVDWLSAWQSGGQTRWTREIADLAVAWLQFFDALSLWFCTAERTALETFRLPDGTSITFTPLGSNRLAVDPWPWPDAQLEVSTIGRTVPTQPYADAKAVAAVPVQTVELRWTLEPQVKMT